MDFDIREALPADEAAIMALLPRLAAFELPPGRSPEELWRGDAVVYRACMAGARTDAIALVAAGADRALLATALVTLSPEILSGAPSAHLEVLVVAAGCEGRGLATAMIAAAEAAARARGAESLSLNVFETNARARSLYERLGYRAEMVRCIKHLSET